MDIEKLAGPIYGFCLKRLGNTFDAQDLAQEILLEIFSASSKTQVRSPEAWAWRIAHNRYARYLNKRHISWLSLDDVPLAASIQSEDHAAADAVFSALHAIAGAYRELLVDHYVNGLSCDEIAKRRGLSPATVRTRLHYGREKLRKRWNYAVKDNRIYDSMDWYIFGNGDIDVTYLESQISRAILRACYTDYKDIEEIAEITGIPCMYIEDELKRLEAGEIVTRKGKRYISGVIIHTAEYMRKLNLLLEEHARGLADELHAVILMKLPDIRVIGFQGCDAELKRMGWWLVPVVLRAACNKAREIIGFERGDFYPRLDGGRGWLVAYEHTDDVRRYYAGCNYYYAENSKFRYFWTDKYLDSSLSALLKRIENSRFDLSDPALAAECIRYGLAEIRNGTVCMNVPRFTTEQYAELNAMALSGMETVTDKLIPLAKQLRQLMNDDTPRHLQNQLNGLFGIDFNAVISVVCDAMEENGILEKPGDAPFVAQIIAVE